jgi:hypothetical protein
MADAREITLERVWDYQFDEALLSMRIARRELQLSEIRRKIRNGAATDATPHEIADLVREIQELTDQRSALRQEVITEASKLYEGLPLGWSESEVVT